MRKRGGRSRGGSKWLYLTAAFLVLAAFLLSHELGLYRLSITVPQEGLNYNFDDNTLQGWTSTSQYIRVENGLVKASASGSGGGTQTYSYKFDGDLGGWEIQGDAGTNHPDLTRAGASWVGQIRENALYLEANAYSPYDRSWSCETWAYSWAKKEFDFAGCQTVKTRFACTSKGAVIKAYKSVSGRQGDFITSWSIPSYGSWTQTEIDLSAGVAGQPVFLYFGCECPPASDPRSDSKNLWIDNLEIEAAKPAFTTEGHIVQEFSFTKGFSGATIKAIKINVDYASEATWNGFWGIKLYEGDILLGTWDFTKGYLSWNTKTTDVKDIVAGKIVKMTVGGVIYSGANWYIDNIRITYVLEIPFITVNLDSGYPANSWVNVSVQIGIKQSGLLVTAEFQDKGFQGVTDANGLAIVKVQTPVSGTYPVRFFATNPQDGLKHEVNVTMTILPSIKATISAEATQHYDNPITFTVKTVDPDRQLPLDADALNVKVLKDSGELATTIKKVATGEYLVSFTASSEGTAKVTVKPEKAQYYPFPDSFDITILKPVIVLTVNVPTEVKAGTSADIYVKTTAPSGSALDVSEVVMYVTDPSGTRNYFSPVRVTKGTYLLSQSFGKEGLWRVEVTCRDATYGTTSATYTVTAVKQEVISLPKGDILLPAGICVAAAAVIALALRRRKA